MRLPIPYMFLLVFMMQLSVDVFGQKASSQTNYIKLTDSFAKVYTTDNSDIPNGQITAIAVDPENTIWLLTDIGLIQYEQDWKTHNDKCFKDPKTMAVDNEGKLWIGTRSGLYNFADGACEKVNTASLNLNYIGINAICIDAANNEYWFGVYNQISKDSSGLITNYEADDIGINCIAHKGDNSIWYTTDESCYAALTNYQKYTWTVFDGAQDGLPESISVVFAKDENGFFNVKSFSSEDASYDGKKWKIHNPDYRLPHNQIYSIAFDNDDNLWVCAEWGIGIYDGKKWFVIDAYEYMSGYTSLVNNFFTCIAFDVRGNILVSHRWNGFIVIDRKEMGIMLEK